MFLSRKALSCCCRIRSVWRTCFLEVFGFRALPLSLGVGLLLVLAAMCGVASGGELVTSTESSAEKLLLVLVVLKLMILLVESLILLQCFPFTVIHSPSTVTVPARHSLSDPEVSGHPPSASVNNSRFLNFTSISSQIALGRHPLYALLKKHFSAACSPV